MTNNQTLIEPVILIEFEIDDRYGEDYIKCGCIFSTDLIDGKYVSSIKPCAKHYESKVELSSLQDLLNRSKNFIFKS